MGSFGSSGGADSAAGGVFWGAADEVDVEAGAGPGPGAGVEEGVGEGSEGVAARFFALCSTLAAALGGSFRFFSIVRAGES